jgi:ribulose-5-phosphate 4-epimerase/fuculose-1-phosphate aldolase
MIAQLRKFEHKLVSQGLCDEGTPVFGALDDRLYWNKDDAAIALLEEVFAGLNISSILFAQPKEPYFTILNNLACDAKEGFFVPNDSETRTFFHDIPVAHAFDACEIIAALQRRRSIFIRDRGIITYGTIGPEQAFVVYSSVCFSSYVKFFSDLLSHTNIDASRKAFALRETEHYLHFIRARAQTIALPRGPYGTRHDILRAMTETGRATVHCRLVDSYFGNISYFDGSSIFISQTASSLDELVGAIDECPVDGSSCAGITASSEFTAHRDIYTRTPVKAVLHGHPKFSVIMSMRCEKNSCEFKDQCHKRCPEKRFIGDVPIVPGEIGTGTYGLCNTLPPALVHSRGAIVFGHGLFTTGKADFSEAFSAMMDIEMICAKRYIEALEA